jgi:hypothetical protein
MARIKTGSVRELAIKNIAADYTDYFLGGDDPDLPSNAY